ncbi:hypothetical protein GGF32_008993 [Allomyces javanicus]|nr:hypothetical protein GGF32_008993 [Allomyces javanicus]
MAARSIIPISQYLARVNAAWPVPVQVLLQQVAQLPTGIDQSVRAYGGDCILLGPPAAPAATPAAAPVPVLPGDSLTVADLASNPIFHALAQDKPALAQMLLMSLQQNSSMPSLPPSRHDTIVHEFRIHHLPLWDAKSVMRIESMFRIPGTTTQLLRDRDRRSGQFGLLVTTNRNAEDVAWRVLTRSGIVLHGRPLIIKSVDPKWDYIARAAPETEVYLIVNLPPQGTVSTSVLSRELEIERVWPFVDRHDYVPGTSLLFGFMSVERPWRPNAMLLRDGFVLRGRKIRVVRINDPATFLECIENAFNKCKEIALADPDLQHFVSTR